MSDAIRTAVIGHPIHHSKSPLIHNHWIVKYGLTGAYEAINVAPKDLERDVQSFIAHDYAGFNVTIPHKIAIMEYCESIDDAAKAIGAVNTIVIKDGKLHGYNTDAFGFIANIKQNAPDFDFTKGSAVVLGAGGAARAIVKGLIDEGVPEIILTNRTREKADAIKDALSPDKINVCAWEDRNDVLAKANLLINASSLGMEGQPALEISLDDLPSDALVTDIVYSPLETPLLTAAKQRGNKSVTGIGMLLHQARPAFEKWYGVLPEVDEELGALILR